MPSGFSIPAWRRGCPTQRENSCSILPAYSTTHTMTHTKRPNLSEQ